MLLQLINSFASSNSSLQDDVNNLSLQLTYIGIAAFGCSFAQVQAYTMTPLVCHLSWLLHSFHPFKRYFRSVHYYPHSCARLHASCSPDSARRSASGHRTSALFCGRKSAGTTPTMPARCRRASLRTSPRSRKLSATRCEYIFLSIQGTLLSATLELSISGQFVAHALWILSD